MTFDMPPNKYSEYLKKTAEFDSYQLNVSNTLASIGFTAGIYTIAKGILPFFKAPINPEKYK